MISNQPHAQGSEHSRSDKDESSTFREARNRMRDQARSMADDAKDRSKSFIDQQKHQLAEKIDHLCHALDGASHKLREEQDENLAAYAKSMSERLQSAAQYVDDVQIEDIFDNVEHFARRQPQVFLGGMFLVGLAAARFLKASGESQQRGQQSRQFSDTGQRGSTSQRSAGAVRGEPPMTTGQSYPPAGSGRESLGRGSSYSPTGTRPPTTGSEHRPPRVGGTTPTERRERESESPNVNPSSESTSEEER